MIDYTRYDAAMAKVKARQAQLNKGAVDGWARMANYAKAHKENDAEIHAAKQDMYAQTPGGNRASFQQYHNPFRGARATSKAAYLQAKYRGMDDNQIRKAGYVGESIKEAVTSTKRKFVGPSKYVVPKYRDIAYNSQVQADVEAGPQLSSYEKTIEKIFGDRAAKESTHPLRSLKPGDQAPAGYVESIRAKATSSAPQQYQDKFNEVVAEGGGMPNAVPISTSGRVNRFNEDGSSRDVPENITGTADTGGNQISSGPRATVSAQDVTSAAPTPGDVEDANVVKVISGSTGSAKNYVPGQLKQNRGELTRGLPSSTREYYAQRFS